MQNNKDVIRDVMLGAGKERTCPHCSQCIEAINNLTVAVKELSAKNTSIPTSIPIEVAPKPERPVWVTFAALGLLIIISLGTGVSYWWTTYFSSSIYEPVQAAAVEVGDTNIVPIQETAAVVVHDTTHDDIVQETEVYTEPVYEPIYEPIYGAVYEEAPAIVYDPPSSPAPPTETQPDPAYYTYQTSPEGFYDPSESGYAYYAAAPAAAPQVVMDPRPEFVALWEQHQNNNIVARVYIAGTGLNALVVQAAPTAAWPVFMNLEVNLLEEDQNTVISDSGTYAFRHILSSYADYDFFLQNPIISLNTLYEVSRWEIFSFYLAPSSFPFNIVSHGNWGDMIMQFSLASLYNTRIDVNQNDRVLTLTTASTAYPGLNYVLQARLYREITS